MYLPFVSDKIKINLNASIGILRITLIILGVFSYRLSFACSTCGGGSGWFYEGNKGYTDMMCLTLAGANDCADWCPTYCSAPCSTSSTDSSSVISCFTSDPGCGTPCTPVPEFSSWWQVVAGLFIAFLFGRWRGFRRHVSGVA